MGFRYVELGEQCVQRRLVALAADWGLEDTADFVAALSAEAEPPTRASCAELLRAFQVGARDEGWFRSPRLTPVWLCPRPVSMLLSVPGRFVSKVRCRPCGLVVVVTP